MCPKKHKVRLCVLVRRSKYGWNTTATVSTHINTVFGEKSYLISDQSDIITPTAWRHWGSQTGAPVSGLAGRHSGSPSRPSHDTHTRMNMLEDTMIITENLCAAGFIWMLPSLDLKNMVIITVHVSDSNTTTVNTGQSLAVWNICPNWEHERIYTGFNLQVVVQFHVEDSGLIFLLLLINQWLIVLNWPEDLGADPVFAPLQQDQRTIVLHELVKVWIRILNNNSIAMSMLPAFSLSWNGLI